MTASPKEIRNDKTAIRPFQVGFPEADLTDLLRRINTTRWPDRETVTDDTQGVRLALMQDLANTGGRTTTGIGASRR